MVRNDISLLPTEINTHPDNRYSYENRQWQGIPSIEVTKKGEIWVANYSGGTGEGADNYVLLCKSENGGADWENPIAVIDPPDKVRAFDPCLWIDPTDRLWLFWAQSYDWYDGRAGVWCSVCENPDETDTKWTTPRRIANGVMMNKPTVLSDGTWCLPCAVWNFIDEKWRMTEPIAEDMKEEGFSNVLISTDSGKTFQMRGHADVSNRCYDEHMIVERTDKSLWMLVRTFYGIGESVSYDNGATWSQGRPTTLGGPNSRFFIRRLQSGKLLLVNHYNFSGRNNLTAILSDDEGKTWSWKFLLDERKNVAYPDGRQTLDGVIHIVYDRERNGKKEILYARFTEEDIINGGIISKASRLKQLVV